MSNFLKLESLIKDHPNKFTQFLNMSRYSYELGNIKKAIEYTERARLLKPNCLEIFLNLGFFAIINGSIEIFCENYNKLYLYRFNSGLIYWLDVLDFQQRQMKAYKDFQNYFNFSTSFITYIFIGSIDADEFRTVVDQYQSLTGYECIYQLGKRVLLEEERRASSSHTRNLRKSKNRKRKKR